MSINNYQAVILAAGRSRRIGIPYPKVFLPYKKQPIIIYLLKKLLKIKKIEKVIIVFNQEGLKEAKEYYWDYFSNPRVLLACQEEPKGTGDALLTALPFLKATDKIIVLCGDTPLIEKSTLARMIKLYEKEKPGIIILTSLLKNPTGYGRILRNKKKEIVAIVEEKNASPKIKRIKEVNSGCYLFDLTSVGDLVKEIKENELTKEYYLTDLVKLAITKKIKVLGIKTKSREIKGINTYQDYLSLLK
uniref:Nucleotidyl transferase domain-containing protein n=1 Tax=candidate division WOR-3 bacterium TaxID=2052148 RepID=A0A7V4E395_UNCW3